MCRFCDLIGTLRQRPEQAPTAAPSGPRARARGRGFALADFCNIEFACRIYKNPSQESYESGITLPMCVGARTVVPRLARREQTREPIGPSLGKPLVSARAHRRRGRKGGRGQQTQPRETQSPRPGAAAADCSVRGGGDAAFDFGRRRLRRSIRCRVEAVGRGVWRENASVSNDPKHLPRRTDIVIIEWPYLCLSDQVKRCKCK